MEGDAVLGIYGTATRVHRFGDMVYAYLNDQQGVMSCYIFVLDMRVNALRTGSKLD